MQPSLEKVKALILDTEQAYTSTQAPLRKEWELDAARADMLKELRQAESLKDLAAFLLRLDYGFCKPYIIRYKEEEDGTPNKQSVICQFEVHCWPTKEDREVWTQYVQFECTGSLNALWLAATAFKANTMQYLKRAAEKQKGKVSEPASAEMSNINVSNIRGRNRNIISYREEESDDESTKKPQKPETKILSRSERAEARKQAKSSRVLLDSSDEASLGSDDSD